MVQIPVGQWNPDLPDLATSGSNEALNVIPASESYKPFPSFGPVSNALTARCQGAIFVRKTDGTGIIFAGDATKLYRLAGSTFSDVSRVAGGAYTTPADGVWTFTQFGPNILATNGYDAYQTFNIDTDANFSALAGTPPIPLYACIAGDFVMTLNQGIARNRVQWCAINNSADWVTSQQTQASRQDLPDGGWGMGIIGSEYAATIFQEFAIRRASYEGPPLIFRFAKISENLGLTIPGALANYRDLIFFVDRSGFYMLQGGVQITPIGEQLVNNTFWRLLDQTNLPRVSSAIDPTNGIYAVAFPDTNATGGTPNHMFIYHWPTQRWAHVQPGVLEMIFSAASQVGYTLDGLDAITTNLDALPFSLDSAVWTGIARRLLGGFDTTHRMGFFSGPALAPTVDTTEAELDTRIVRVRSARPEVDGGTPSVTLGLRNRQMDPVVWGSAVAVNAIGTCPQNSAGRFFRGRITLPASQTWTHIIGLDDLDAKPEGRQ